MKKNKEERKKKLEKLISYISNRNDEKNYITKERKKSLCSKKKGFKK
jgi:hypothetical protein